MTTDLERRLRHAFEARTAGVHAPPEPDWDRPRSRAAYPVFGIVAAVAATLAVLLAANLVPGGGGRSDDGPFTPGAVAATPVRPAASPSFALRMESASGLQVVDVATGKVRGTVQPPAGYGELWAGHTAAAADNRTFFFSVRKSLKGRPMVARVHVDDRGRPDGRALLVAQAPTAGDLEAVAPRPATRSTNGPARWAALDGLSVSPDATRLAMVVSTAKAEGVSVWDLGTGRRTTWGSPVPVTALAWSGDGSLLWASDRSAGSLDPAGRPGVLRAARTHPAVADPVPPRLLPNGDRITVLTGPGSVRLVRLPALPGRPERVLDEWKPNGGDEGPVVVDGSGRHVLYGRNGKRERMDLATRRHKPTNLDGPDDKTSAFTW